ncbi:MAG: hypothetical protein LDL55_10775 [Armatimonadetes bacterium]|nr:hypothetical protein [Armatimonadota bacterium]
MPEDVRFEETRSFPFRAVEVSSGTATARYGRGWARVVRQQTPFGTAAILVYTEAAVSDGPFHCGEVLRLRYETPSGDEEFEGRCVGLFLDPDSGFPFLLTKAIDR